MIKHSKSGCQTCSDIRLYFESVSNGLYLRSYPSFNDTVYLTLFLSGFHCILCFPIQLSFYRNHIFMMHLVLISSHLRFTSRIPCRRPSILICIVCRTWDSVIYTLVYFTSVSSFVLSVLYYVSQKLSIQFLHFFIIFLILFRYVMNILTTMPLAFTYKSLLSSWLRQAYRTPITPHICHLP